MSDFVITKEDVLGIHAQQIARFGGSDGYYGGTLACVERTVTQAHQGAYYCEGEGSLCFYVAALLLYYLAKGHCFVDGNKRVAFHASLLVLAKDQLTLSIEQNSAAEFVLAISSPDGPDRASVIDWMGGCVCSLSP